MNKKNKIIKIREDNLRFKKMKSLASCKISDIEGFIIGPNSTRFWMMRKHINSLTMNPGVDPKLPFFSW